MQTPPILPPPKLTSQKADAAHSFNTSWKKDDDDDDDDKDESLVNEESRVLPVCHQRTHHWMTQSVSKVAGSGFLGRNLRLSDVGEDFGF